MKQRTLYRNGATQILVTVYAVLFIVIGLILGMNVLMGQRQWNLFKLLSWADNVINLTRDTLADQVSVSE